MKFSIVIADMKILTASDTKTWIGLSKKLAEPKTDTTPELKEIITLIKSGFPELPNTMVWGNYLIFEEFADFFTIDIDYDDIKRLEHEILDIALENGFAVLIGKENKIYKPKT